ncbi:MAG: hypothetical protein EHM18_08175 [Acidobacteria bacterium]|nr:MAG: hypothetical protein EHM18_08175 [Acidobacteriota bacterium]
MTRTVSRTFRTVAPAAGAPTISFLYPPEGQIGKEVRIRGTGFNADPSKNQVTFAGSGTQRLPAAIKNASASEVAIFVPYGAVTGPVQIAVDGAKSNDYLFHVLFRPDIAAGFPEFTAGASVKPIIWLDQPSTDVAPLASAKLTLDAGRINASGLVADAQAGEALVVSDYSQTAGVLTYRGLEPSGEKRHRFEVVGGGETLAWVYAVNSPGPKGVVFEVVLDSLADKGVRGQSLQISFTKDVYTVPAPKGTEVNRTMDLWSGPWNLFGWKMLVTVVDKITAQ